MQAEYARPVVKPPAYEYHGLMAEAWDLLRGDTSVWEDRPFYLELIRRFGEPVLDVGCGTGRLLLDYLAEGVEIEGVDVSPDMLALCRAKASTLGLEPTLYEQAVEDLQLPRRYRTIIVPSSSIQLVIDPATAERAVARLAAHLEPGGALVMPFMILEGDESWAVEALRPDGALVRRTARSHYDPVTQLEDTDDLYEVVVDGEVVAAERHVQKPATRSYTVDQARALYLQGGLELEQIVDGFSDQPFEDGLVFTIIGSRR
jgi:ubiquinone/menaquinone biosynthesis C-methylase UbiE